MGNVVFECAQPMGSMKLEDAGYGKLLVVDAGDGKAPSTLQIPNDKLEAFADAVRGGLTAPQEPTRETYPAPCVNGVEMERDGEGWQGSCVKIVHVDPSLGYEWQARFEGTEIDECRLFGASGNPPQRAVDILMCNLEYHLGEVHELAASLGIRHDPSTAPTCTPAPARASTQSDAEVSAIQDPAGDARREPRMGTCGDCGKVFHAREEILEFALCMEAKLEENDHKAHWLEAGDVPSFLKRSSEELAELEDAVTRKLSPDEVEAEAADVANMAMMVAQRYRQDLSEPRTFEALSESLREAQDAPA